MLPKKIKDRSKPTLSSKGSIPTGAETEKKAKAAAAAAPVVAAAHPSAHAQPAAIVPTPTTPAVAVLESKSESKAEGRDRSAIIALINNLQHPDADAGRDAAIRLGSLPADPAAIDALIAAVTNQDGYFHPVVRAAAATALGKLGDKKAVDALILATRDTMAEASEEAVIALGLLGDPRAKPALQLVSHNADNFFLEHVRRAAQLSLAKIK